MLHASTQKLIVKLCELTEAGHIAWKRGKDNACRFETEGYVVEVEGDPPTLRLLHSDGRELERADQIDLAAQPWPEGGSFATQITLLAARADRIARGAEFAISRILTSLAAPPKAAPFEFLPETPEPLAENAAPPPPAPHTAPTPLPDPIVTDTAIDRVLAAEALAPETEPVVIESETSAVTGAPQAVEEAAAEVSAELGQPLQEAPVAKVEPVIIEAEAVAIVAEPAPVEPLQALEQPVIHQPAPRPEPRPERPRIVIPRPKQTFGATASFAKPLDPSATPRSASPKPFSTSPLFFGVNQLSREPAPRAEPEPPPVPPPSVKPIQPVPPVAEKKPAPAIAGPDIYKPWS